MATITEAIKNLYESKDDDGDVTFVVHGHDVKAHKSIVTSRSEMLKRMLNSDLAPANGRHRIDDEKIKVEVFEEFLKFLYLDYCDIDYKNIGALLHMGDMYFVPLLKQKCMKCVQSECSISVDKILRCCELGSLYEKECPEMLEICIGELGNKDFHNYQISAELVERIAKDCPRMYSNTSSENELFVKIFEWGKAECTRRNIPADKDGIKIILFPILKHIKFENVSLHSWVHIIDQYELAPLEECHKTLSDIAKCCNYSALQLTPQMLKNGATLSLEKREAFGPGRGRGGYGVINNLLFH